MSARVVEATCSGCGATYVTTARVCPLCGRDPRLDVIEEALRTAAAEWATDEEAAVRILALLDAEAARNEMGDDDA